MGTGLGWVGQEGDHQSQEWVLSQHSWRTRQEAPAETGPEHQRRTLSQALCTREAGQGPAPHEGTARAALRPAHPQFSSSLSSGLMAGLVRL